MESDFVRALEVWPDFTQWRFVTNAPAGPLAAACLIEIQRAHNPASQRPISARLWGPDALWSEVVGRLSPEDLNDLFPGVPRSENAELSDLVPLLDSLGGGTDTVEANTPVNPVPVTKMDYNLLSKGARIEFNEGRLFAPRIDRWFEERADPDLRDNQGRRFRSIYERHRETTESPGEILERLYTSLAGSDFRFDDARANAVYAVTAYFFDLCHIFEEPPAAYGGEVSDALADEGN